MFDETPRDWYSDFSEALGCDRQKLKLLMVGLVAGVSLETLLGTIKMENSNVRKF